MTEQFKRLLQEAVRVLNLMRSQAPNSNLCMRLCFGKGNLVDATYRGYLTFSRSNVVLDGDRL